MMRVDFLIAGVQKGGTSALDAHLRKHPEICLASGKEVHFFDSEGRFPVGPSDDYADYHAIFKPGPATKITGEATPIYMYWKSAPGRIRAYNPEMKILIVLRNPIERAFSHWNMERERGTDKLSFWEALQNEEVRCRTALPLQHTVYSYVDRGFYMTQLRRIWDHFPQDQVLILRNETLRQHPGPTLDQVCQFLGVARFREVRRRDVYSIPYEAPMSRRERDFLRRSYQGEIHELEKVLGWDCSDWLEDEGGRP